MTSRLKCTASPFVVLVWGRERHDDSGGRWNPGDTFSNGSCPLEYISITRVPRQEYDLLWELRLGRAAHIYILFLCVLS